MRYCHQWRQRLVNIGEMNSSFLSIPRPLPSFPFPSLIFPFPPSPFILSLPFHFLPPLLSHSLPPPPFLGGLNPLIRLGGLGERLSSPSGSGRSQAARRFLVHFRLKRTLLVIIIIKEVLYQSTVELSRQRLFDWQY